MEDNRRFSWTDLFIKIILVIIFVLFTVWLLSLSNRGISNSLDVLTDNIFAENMERMKEVGKEYFTIERLPEKVGDIETLTLEKMYDKKLILELKDKNGNACSAENSYVSIEKYDTEYQMKVYLECGEESDYIIVIMGCYDYCDTDICEKKDTESKQIEYEYKKSNGGYWTEYGSWSDWSKVAVTGTNYRQVETKVVEEAYSYDKTVTETLYEEIETSCPEGYKKTSAGTKCYRASTSYSYADPVCADRTSEGFTLAGRNGFTCTYTKKVANTTDPVACPAKDGWEVTRNGFTCTYTTTVKVPYQTSYQQPYQVAYQVAVGQKIVSTCDGCAKQVVTIYETRYRTEYKTVYVTNYKDETKTETSQTSCPNGYSNVNGTCTKYDTVTETNTASCSTGYNKSDNKCAKSVTNYSYKDIVKSCPVGYDMSSDSTNCYKNIDSIVKVEGTKKVTYYRYRIREYVGGTADYKWSTSNEDKELLNAGYTLTGKTR